MTIYRGEVTSNSIGLYLFLTSLALLAGSSSVYAAIKLDQAENFNTNNTEAVTQQENSKPALLSLHRIRH